MLFDKHTSTQVMGVVTDKQTVELITIILYNALEVGTANLDKINEEQQIGIEFTLKLLTMVTTLVKFDDILHSNESNYSVEVNDIENVILACHIVIELVNDCPKEVHDLLNKILIITKE